jgi:hypothetical protein
MAGSFPLDDSVETPAVFARGEGHPAGAEV